MGEPDRAERELRHAQEKRCNRLDIAAASCQAWSAGYYTAHRHLAAELPDAVIFLGDYIYERTVDERECGRVVSDLPAAI